MTLLIFSVVVSLAALAVLLVHSLRHRELFDSSRERMAAQNAERAIAELSRLNSVAASSLERAAGHLTVSK